MDPFYRSLLNPIEQKAYDRIFSALINLRQECNYPTNGISLKRSTDIVQYVMFDHPELFYIRNQYAVSGSGLSTVVSFKYETKRIIIEERRNRLKEYLSKNFGSLKYEKDFFKKELFVHDFLAERITYVETGPDSHSLIGPMLEEKGVCEGIAELAKVIFDYLGMDCYNMHGSINDGSGAENHLWTVLRYNDMDYHLDITNDLKGANPSLKHLYFNWPSKFIARTHTFDQNLPIKPATLEFNYFHHEGKAFKEVSDAIAYVKKAKGRIIEMALAKSIANESNVQTIVSSMSQSLFQFCVYEFNPNFGFLAIYKKSGLF
ncbi:MAG: hypothetical protein K5694_00035 [Bacilli bacterium]|nr:hypothetical protein [Bacilli bacterium]